MFGIVFAVAAVVAAILLVGMARPPKRIHIIGPQQNAPPAGPSPAGGNQQPAGVTGWRFWVFFSNKLLAALLIIAIAVLVMTVVLNLGPISGTIQAWNLGVWALPLALILGGLILLGLGAKKVGQGFAIVGIAIAGLMIFMGPDAVRQIGSNFGSQAEALAAGRLPSYSIDAPAITWSNPIRLTAEKCIFAWGENPDGNAFVAQVRTINDPRWHNWEDRPSSFAWIRFQSTNNSPTVVSYEFRRRGECS